MASQCLASLNDDSCHSVDPECAEVKVEKHIPYLAKETLQDHN